MYASPANRTSSWKRLMTCAVCRTVIALCHAGVEVSQSDVLAMLGRVCAPRMYITAAPHVQLPAQHTAILGTAQSEEGPTGLLHGCDATLADAIGRIWFHAPRDVGTHRHHLQDLAAGAAEAPHGIARLAPVGQRRQGVRLRGGAKRLSVIRPNSGQACPRGSRIRRRARLANSRK